MRGGKNSRGRCPDHESPAHNCYTAGFMASVKGAERNRVQAGVETRNKLHSLDKDLFDHLEGLQELILNDNDLQEIDAQTTAAISSITALESLSLAETGLTDLPQGVFNSLIQLTWMNLANNEFETVPTKAIGSARNLRDLNLNGNPIRELNQQSFVGMSELTALNISAMPELTVIRRETFAPLRKLHSLRCSNNNKLTSIDPFAFEGIADSRNEYPIREIKITDLIDTFDNFRKLISARGPAKNFCAPAPVRGPPVGEHCFIRLSCNAL
ncbi:unnamed protein product [Notodromas monacha]|uniref:Uncharacterized protein n=1 Tax=Notodromas monacha TaxID=399045 RepID=A0A7R9BEE8_9CRUS|nr:unnamed protein product [Notodromas monacha]CAG0913152.1 unnamed protein product [Notodromas monacha]